MTPPTTPAQVEKRRRAALIGGQLRGQYSEATLAKLVDPASWLDGITPDEQDPSVYWVKSWNDGNPRRVQIISDSWIICSCANGRHAGGNARCYHAAMVELSL